MERKNHKYTSNIVCPWCGHEHEEPWEYFNARSGDGEICDLECADCEKEFEASMHIEVEYCTTIRNCPGHKFALDDNELYFVGLEKLAEKESVHFHCGVCNEDFYSWQLPGGKYPKLKEGSFEFVGEAKRLMELRVQLGKTY